MVSLRKVLREEVRKIGLPGELRADAYPVIEGERAIIDMPDKESYFQFRYQPKSKAINDIEIALDKNFQGKGYARSLVTAMENVAKRLQCSEIVVNKVSNITFWEHLGYERVGRDKWVKKL